MVHIFLAGNDPLERSLCGAAKPRRAPDTPVFVGSGFIQATSIQGIEDPRTRSFLLAPAYTYKVPGGLFPIPYSPAEGAAYLSRILPGLVQGRPRAFVISSDPAWHTWFATNDKAARHVARLHPFVSELEISAASLER